MKAKTKKLEINVKLVIWLLILAGVVLLLLSFKIDNPEQSIYYKLLSALGQTFIGSAVVSYFLSFTEIRNFFFDIIKEIMIEHHFHDVFKTEQLENMHNSCHQTLHFQDVDKNEKDWQQISQRCIESFRMPYHQFWREDVECSLQKDKIKKIINLHYELCNPRKGVVVSAMIARDYFLDIPNGEDPNNYIRIDFMTIIADDKKYELKPDIVFKDAKGHNYNTKATIKSDDIDLYKIQFRDKVEVILRLFTLVSQNDRLYTNRLKYPAKQFHLGFTCRDENVKMHPNFFGSFVKRNEFELYIGDGHVYVDCKNKHILPGSGACVVLDIEKSSKSKNKPKKALH